MISSAEKKEILIQTGNQLLDPNTGFSAAWLAVQYLFDHIRKKPENTAPATIKSLLHLISSERFTGKKQAFFLYREAVCALTFLAENSDRPMSEFIIMKIRQILMDSGGPRHRAVSEGLGTLPLKISGPEPASAESSDIIHIKFNLLSEILKIQDISSYTWHGRTLVFQTACQNGKRLACIKFAKAKTDAPKLAKEIQWQRFLHDNPPCAGSAFKIPEPFSAGNRMIFILDDLPDNIRKGHCHLADSPAMIYLADTQYFDYPNDFSLFRENTEYLRHVFADNAWISGRLASLGIVHTAIIPLFHNRVQQNRRQDRGIYLWEHGGRLDRWLESSQYPNFACSGLRDFEHLISVKDSSCLRHHMGEHILGFILVAGSFFRNKAPEKKGFDSDGLALDVRYLFEKPLFTNLIIDIIAAYYKGFTGMTLHDPEAFLTENLMDQLIDAMGVDLHMEEVLRARDQHRMTEEEFKNFLISREFDQIKIQSLQKGQKDIIVHTGPHLGGFNQAVNVPELMDLLFRLSALCIADRYLGENGLKHPLN